VRSLLVLTSVVVLVCLVGTASGSAPFFGRTEGYATGKFPWSVAIGDLNGDGKLDLATANFDNHVVSVLLNRR
jgi:hypothetical protein